MSASTEAWEIFTAPAGDSHQCGTPIDGVHYTLFYDYDEVRDGKLWSPATSDDVRIEWLRRRIFGVLIEPLARVLSPGSPAFRELNSELHESSEHRAYMDIIEAIILARVNEVTAANGLELVEFQDATPPSHPAILSMIGDLLRMGLR